MNKLSWLIYVGELSGSLSGVFAALAVISAIATMVFLLYGAAVRDNSYKGSEEHKAGVSIQKKALKLGAIFFPVFLVVSALLPSKQTVYLIAASEAGEKAVQTPEFGKLRQVINQYLDEKLSASSEKRDK